MTAIPRIFKRENHRTHQTAYRGYFALKTPQRRLIRDPFRPRPRLYLRWEVAEQAAADHQAQGIACRPVKLI